MSGRSGAAGRRTLGRAGAVIVLVVLSAALWGASGRLGQLDEGGGEWAQVHREDLVLGVETTGTLSAVDAAQLGPPDIPQQWNFKIAYMAPEGIEVRAGTPVLRFDTTDLEGNLVGKLAEEESARQEYEKQAASLEVSRRDLELRLAEAEAKRRKGALKIDVPSDLVAAKELAQSRADLALAGREIAYVKEQLAFTRRQGEAELAALAKRRDRAAARVGEIRTQLRSMTVTAPRDGTVVYISSRRTEKKKVGDNAWQAEKVLEIPDLRRMRAEGEVDEADAGRVALGQPLTLRLDAHPEIAFTGRIADIRRAVQQRSDETRQKVIGVTFALDRTDPQRMRPGMRFRGLVETGRVRGALVVAAEAVEASPQGPLVRRRTVFGGAEEVSPRLGRRNGRLVEVLGGLAAGDLVALGNGSGQAPAGGEGSR